MVYDKIIQLAALYEEASKRPRPSLYAMKLMDVIQDTEEHIRTLEKRRSLFRNDDDLEDRIMQAKQELFSLKDDLRREIGMSNKVQELKWY